MKAKLKKDLGKNILKKDEVIRIIMLSNIEEGYEVIFHENGSGVYGKYVFKNKKEANDYLEFFDK